MHRSFVGVDAGGSRTVAAAARAGESPRVFSGAPANARVLGIERAVAAITDAVNGALAGDGAAAIFVGAAGAAMPETSDAIAAALRERFPNVPLAVAGDAHVALRAAIPNGDAMALIAGTGCVAYAEIGGRQYRAGGYGFALGDEGSGYAIGRAALGLLLRSYDGRAPRDEMLDALAQRTGGDTAGALAYAYGDGVRVAAIAALAPLVLEFANGGERSANKIVQAAALELFELVRAVCRMTEIGNAEVPIAFAGGLLSRNSLLTYLIETRLSNDFPHVSIVKGGAEPHLGALAQARGLVR
jgi:N-acetylmuramic acid 6-phosphate etherase